MENADVLKLIAQSKALIENYLNQSNIDGIPAMQEACLLLEQAIEKLV